MALMSPARRFGSLFFDRMPWPRSDILFSARANWQGREAWTERQTRLKLRQAFGRLIRRSNDRGVFVMLDSRLPTRMTSAFHQVSKSSGSDFPKQLPKHVYF
ncbi:MAG: helicase C-terminal domain-containing protein [Candidatus Puniceispirillaceae bacterium]